MKSKSVGTHQGRGSFSDAQAKILSAGKQAKKRGKGTVWGTNSGDPSQMYPWREIIARMRLRARGQSGRIDSRGEQEV
jgi:hypothetical protein